MDFKNGTKPQLQSRLCVTPYSIWLRYILSEFRDSNLKVLNGFAEWYKMKYACNDSKCSNLCGTSFQSVHT